MEPLLRMPRDGRAQLALAQFAEAADEPEDVPPPAAAIIERNRIAELLREYMSRATGRSGWTV